ncbi:hypothetical protein [Pedobacter gandavensis]|uniref:hypothetical protein n=1 Tax=Pedobacter gandavensis TaxID=2679963 RepID=UPI00292E5433|nr:hypothetical protein [Pedobacter gandavensis]
MEVFSRLKKKIKHRRLLADDNYGTTKEERIRKLNQARKVAKILNVLGVLIGAAMLFFKWNIQIPVAFGMIAPVVFVLILKRYKGLITLEEKKNSPNPSIIWGLLAVMIAILLRSILAYDILDFKGIWIPAALVSLCFFALMAISIVEFKSRKPEQLFGMFIMAMISFGYGFGTIVLLNCEFDQSTPIQYHATILGRSISGSKSKSYHLELSPWGPRKEKEEVSVSHTMFNRLNNNEKVNIYLYQGKLKIPWFYVTD